MTEHASDILIIIDLNKHSIRKKKDNQGQE